MRDQRKGSERHVRNRLTEVERQAFYEEANTARFADKAPEQIVAILAQEGRYFGSPSTLYRILREKSALEHRRESKKPRASASPTMIEITAKNQVWAWDITWIKTDVEGLFFYAYTIIDLYDRTIVGWTIETTESDQHAMNLFRRIIRETGVCPQIIHADNGNAMRGMTLACFLDKLQISRSHSRPRCSNDNAFIESFFKTLKYTVGYPKMFTSLDHARIWFADFVSWYNHSHLHSGLAYVTPNQMRSGEAELLFKIRNSVLREAMERNPRRWIKGVARTYKPLLVRIPYRPFARVA